MLPSSFYHFNHLTLPAFFSIVGYSFFTVLSFSLPYLLTISLFTLFLSIAFFSWIKQKYDIWQVNTGSIFLFLLFSVECSSLSIYYVVSAFAAWLLCTDVFIFIRQSYKVRAVIWIKCPSRNHFNMVETWDVAWK